MIAVFNLLVFILQILFIHTTEHPLKKAEVYSHNKIVNAEYYKLEGQSSLTLIDSESVGELVFNDFESITNNIVWNQYFAKPYRFDLTKFGSLADSNDNITIKLLDGKKKPIYALTKSKPENKWELYEVENQDTDNQTYNHVRKVIMDKSGMRVFIDDTHNLSRSYRYIEYMKELEEHASTIKKKAIEVLERLLEIRSQIEAEDKSFNTKLIVDIMNEIINKMKIFYKAKAAFYTPTIGLEQTKCSLEDFKKEKVILGLEILETRLKRSKLNNSIQIDHIADIYKGIETAWKEAQIIGRKMFFLIRTTKTNMENTHSYFSLNTPSSDITGTLVNDIAKVLCEVNEIVHEYSFIDFFIREFVNIPKSDVPVIIELIEYFEQREKYLEMCCGKDESEHDKKTNTGFLIDCEAAKGFISDDSADELTLLRIFIKKLRTAQPNEGQKNTTQRCNVQTMIDKIDKCLQNHMNVMVKHADFFNKHELETESLLQNTQTKLEKSLPNDQERINPFTSNNGPHIENNESPTSTIVDDHQGREFYTLDNDLQEQNESPPLPSTNIDDHQGKESYTMDKYSQEYHEPTSLTSTNLDELHEGDPNSLDNDLQTQNEPTSLTSTNIDKLQGGKNDNMDKDSLKHHEPPLPASLQVNNNHNSSTSSIGVDLNSLEPSNGPSDEHSKENTVEHDKSSVEVTKEKLPEQNPQEVDLNDDENKESSSKVSKKLMIFTIVLVILLICGLSYLIYLYMKTNN